MGIVNSVISLLVGGLLGTVAFIILKGFVIGANTAGWTATDVLMVGVFPTVLGIGTMILMFRALSGSAS